MATLKSFQPNKKILAEGTFGTETFVIQSGNVLIQKETGGKSPVTLAVLNPGDVFGEMYLFEDVGFRSASAVAQTDVTVEIVDQSEMTEKLANTPELIQKILKSLNNRLDHTSQDYSMNLVKAMRKNEAASRRNSVLMAVLLIVQLVILFK